MGVSGGFVLGSFSGTNRVLGVVRAVVWLRLASFFWRVHSGVLLDVAGANRPSHATGLSVWTPIAGRVPGEAGRWVSGLSFIGPFKERLG